MDGLEAVFASLPGLGAFGGFAALMVLAIRMAAKADARYNAEVKEHKETQDELDDERERRRRLEEQLSEVKIEVQHLRTEVTMLRAQIAGAT